MASDQDLVCDWADDHGALRARVTRADGEPFDASGVRVEIAVPLLNFAHVVVPDCGRHYVLSSKSLDIRAAERRVGAANAGHPFFALADEVGDFLFAFGVLSAPGEVIIRRVLPRISTRMALVGGDDELQLEIIYPGPGRPVESLDVALFAQADAPTWHHALTRYAALIAEREGIEHPAHDDAWLPTWCTWTAFGSPIMTADRVLEHARVAKELGIGAVILDDGWFGPGLDDDATLNIGDYDPDPAKFPDLPGHVRELQAMGLKAILWHAPLCVARTSKAYPRLERFAMHQDGEAFTSVNGLAQLCPACPEVRDYVAAETRRLFEEYGVDGLKVDLYNCLPMGMCDSPHHHHDHDDAVLALDAVMDTVWRAAREAHPGAILELKQDYGNARLSRHGTMVRAGDTAYDIDTNLRRCFYTQAVAPVVHNDYLATSAHTRPEALGLLVMKMLIAGVPTFGIDLVRLTDEQKAVIRRWMDFYHEHLAMFRQPRRPQVNDLSVWEGGDDSLAWVAALWQADCITLPPASRVVVLNATGADRLRVLGGGGGAWMARDRLGREVAQGEAAGAAEGDWITAPSGGTVEWSGLASGTDGRHATGAARRG